MNQGAFQFAKLHLDRMLADRGQAPITFVGRKSIHSFASGSPNDNKKEIEKLWEDFDKALAI
jgi:2-oxoglutarate dehydrogenase complex dehydrogenase (E1) component-like enzyme